MVKQPPFDVGDEIVIFVDYVDDANVPTNPTTVTLQIGRRDGTILATHPIGDLTNPTAGRFEFKFEIPETDLVFSWDATGVVTMAREGEIPTRRRTLAPPP